MSFHSGACLRLGEAGAPAMLDRIARACANARAHAWTLIAGTAAGFPGRPSRARSSRGPTAVPVLPAQGNAVHLRLDDHAGRRGRHPPAPRGAWKPGTAQDGSIEEDKDVAEITGLMTRAVNWPEGLRGIVRRVKPSRRQMRNLTACEKETGWRYSITCVRTAKAMGLRGLPSKTWQVNCGWVAAANIAADLAAWTRLLGHADEPELRDAAPDTLRTRTRLTSTDYPSDTEGGPPGAVGAGAHPGTPGIPRTTRPKGNGHEVKKRMQAQSVSEPEGA